MNDKVSCKTCSSHYDCFIGKNCSAQWVDIVDSSKEQHWYKKGHYIFKQGNHVEGIYFVCQGKIKVITNSFRGAEQIVRLASNGHILGHKGLENDVYSISAIAMTNSLVCFVDNHTLDALFTHNPQLSHALMLFYSRELRKSQLRMMYLGQMNVREKVAEVLLYINTIFGTNADDGTLNMDSCRQEIAKLICISNDQITKQLKNFVEEELITKLKRSIRLINPQGLEKIVRHYKIEELHRQQ
ncbi:MAG TPA: Crp/Fnr family transcriptional regulator [Bacteroidia bacterium]